jgi:MarR family transcriptional regulator, organic hydroperoxide resistance regulator
MKASECKFSQCLYFSSNALARKIEKMAQDVWNDVGLAPSHAYILMTVLEQPGIQAGHIANQVQLKPSTVTRLLEKLEDMKLLVRTSAGKITNVYPTPKASALQPKLKACLYSFVDKYTRVLGKEESQRLVEQINRTSDKLG